MSLLLPLEVEELRAFLAGSGASVGEKSPLGPQLERARLGLSRQAGYPDRADSLGQAVVDWIKVDRRLREAGPKARRVLEAYYGPPDVRGPDPDQKEGERPDHGHVAPLLPLYEQLGRVMLLTRASGDATESVLRRADEHGRKGDREAACWLAEVRAEALELVTWAEAAYAKTRPPKECDHGRAAEARGERERERRGHYEGRTDGLRRVVFSTPSARAAGRRAG